VESFLGVLCAGAVPINVNFRYITDELRHVLSDSHAVALIAEDSLAARVTAALPDLPGLRHVVLIEDGSERDTALAGVDYETALAAQNRKDPLELPPTSGDSSYLLYTGGTPKGCRVARSTASGVLGGSVPEGRRVVAPRTRWPSGPLGVVRNAGWFGGR